MSVYLNSDPAKDYGKNNSPKIMITFAILFFTVTMTVPIIISAYIYHAWKDYKNPPKPRIFAKKSRPDDTEWNGKPELDSESCELTPVAELEQPPLPELEQPPLSEMEQPPIQELDGVMVCEVWDAEWVGEFEAD